MKNTSRFVVLVERVAQAQRWDWLKVGALLVLSAALLTSAPSLRAQTAESKIATDLRQVISARTTPTLNWAKDVNGARHVKVLILSESLILSEGLMLSESGQPNVSSANDSSLLGEP